VIAEADPDFPGEAAYVQEWSPRRDLLGSTATDAHFAVEVDDSGRAHLRFGDGELCMQPEAGAHFYATYRVGNGPIGNVGVDRIVRMVLRNQSLHGVGILPRNPLPAQGGLAPEPLDEVKLFAPDYMRTDMQRAVTADDYAQLVMRLFKDRVQRAAAMLRWTGGRYEVQIAVDPLGSVERDRALLDCIREKLEPYRRIGHDVVVQLARYVPLEAAITVCVKPHFLRGHVKAALLDLFSNRPLGGGRRGFFHPDNLSFGENIYLSRLVAEAMTVAGVDNVRVDVLQRRFEGPNGEIESGVLPLGPFEIARLDNDPSFPENGALTFNMEGGR
jgi:predicted phage baseplate assembly protein